MTSGGFTKVLVVFHAVAVFAAERRVTAASAMIERRLRGCDVALLPAPGSEGRLLDRAREREH